ncbi:MAG: hypothetical protein ACQKBY_11230 [Verrucomicrobiales bacterium]
MTKAEMLQREQVVNTLDRIDAARLEMPHTESFQHDRICEANASSFDEAHLSEPLTDYAVDWRDESGLDEALDFYAPEVPVGQRFEYRSWVNADEFENDENDERAIGEDFKTIYQGGSLVQDKLLNRGLQIFVDEDEVNGDPNWRERRTGKLLRRLKRNSLIRAVNLLLAAAPNAALTWDTSAGKDPDQDIEDMLAAAGDSSGMDPNRVAYGRTAWLKRKKSHRAQDTAGGTQSAFLNPSDLAASLGIDEAFVAKARYGTGASKTRLMGDIVLAFTAYRGLGPDDPSNIKRFYQMLDGQRYRVYEWRMGPKKYAIAVEHYERTRITTLLGLAKRTIS